MARPLVLACTAVALLAALALLAAAALAQPTVYVYSGDAGVLVTWKEVPLAPHTSWVSSVSASLSAGYWTTGYYNYSGWLILRNANSAANASWYYPKITVHMVFFKPGYVTVRYASLPQAGVSAAIIANCTGIPSAGGYTGGVKVATFTVSAANTLTPIGPYSFKASSICLTYNATAYAGVYLALGLFYNYTVNTITATYSAPPLNPLSLDLSQPRSYAYTVRSINVTAPRFLRATSATSTSILNSTYYVIRIADGILKPTLTPTPPSTAYGISAPALVVLTTDFTQPVTGTRFTIVTVGGELSTVKVNSTVIYVAPFANRTVTVNPPSAPTPITFYVNDYGQNYAVLLAYDAHNRLVGSQPISPATRSAVLNLTAYQNYILSLWKKGEERVLGPVTVSQTQYSLTVLPQLQPAPPPSTAVVWYNSSLPGYVVDVSCASPPCTITLVKKQATQPQLLSAEFTMPSSGATIAPHLFMWSFDGVDDYMVCGLQPDGSGVPFTVYGWPAATFEDFLFIPRIAASTHRSTSMIGDPWTDYPHTRIVTDPDFTYIYALWAGRTSDGKWWGLQPNIISIADRWGHVVRRFTDAREYSVWVNGSRVYAGSVPSSVATVLEWDPSTARNPAYYRRFTVATNVVVSSFLKMWQSYARIWSRALSDAEIQAFAAGSTVINATGLRLFVDPSWCSGTTCFNLVNESIPCRMYNGVARIPDNGAWLWVVQGLPGDGKLHFRFFPEGSRATVWCGSTILDVQLGWSDVAVQVPAGEKCRVAVHVAAQPYILETASYTCGEARCRFTWITGDPFLEARVEDAAGSTYVVFSGTSLPQQPGGLPGLADLVNWLAGRTGLDYLVGPGAVQAFLVALGSVLLLIAFSTAGSWEFGLLAAAAGLVLLPILLGAPPLTVPAGLVIALAALSLMLRKEREE